jgi:hypothetical protein
VEADGAAHRQERGEECEREDAGDLPDEPDDQAGERAAE